MTYRYGCIPCEATIINTRPERGCFLCGGILVPLPRNQSVEAWLSGSLHDEIRDREWTGGLSLADQAKIRAEQFPDLPVPLN